MKRFSGFFASETIVFSGVIKFSYKSFMFSYVLPLKVALNSLKPQRGLALQGFSDKVCSDHERRISSSNRKDSYHTTYYDGEHCSTL